MLDTSTEALRELRGQRVRITFHDGETHTAVLDGVTSEQIYFSGEPSGVDRFEIASITTAPLVCSVCGRETNRLFEDMCAEDYRKNASRRPPVREQCERDGCTSAGVREPGTNEFLCAVHHAEAGHTLRIARGSAGVLAECALEDVNSDKHEWKQARGARFRCVRCQTAEKWDPALLKELEAGRLER